MPSVYGPEGERVEFRVLGPLEVLDGGEPIAVGARQQRLLLSLLLLNANRVVTTDRILEELWGDEAVGKENALWVYISRLRSALGEREVLVTRDHGYSLVVDAEEIDVNRFESGVLAGRALIKDDPAAASELLSEALALWRGPPLEEFAYEDFAQAEIVRLEELRSGSQEDRIEADLRRGLAGELVGELESLHAENPTRERVVSQLMLALYRAGRQSDALRTFERFRLHLGEELGLDPSPELRLLEEQILLHDSRIQTLEPASRSSATAPVVTNPFKGLRAFYEDDAADFFGRSQVVADVIRRLDSDLSLIGLVGPSGSGKSSIVRAGVIPAIRKGAIEGSSEWVIAQMVPGVHPFAELEAALLRSSLDTPDSLSEQLADPDSGVLRAVLRVLPSENSCLLLVIDQFEELFTLVDDEERRAQFLSGLLEVTADPHGRVKVIFTLRADFYDRPLAYADFGSRMGEGIINVVPLSPDELEVAARRPVEEAGATMEPALVAALLTDVVGRPGGLPLFQYALTELFDRRIDNKLSLSTYESMDGVGGALGRRADDLFGGLDSEQQAAAKQLFLRLVTIADSDEWGRRRVPASEIVSLDIDVVAAQAAIDSFARHRLLTVDRDSVTGSPTVEVAHEALLTEWGRLREWIEDAREDLKRRDTLTVALNEWNDAGQDPDYLLSGARLVAYEAWAANSVLRLTTAEQAFIGAGGDRRDGNEDDRLALEATAKRSARWRLLAVAAAFVALIGVVGAVFLATRSSDPLQVGAFGPSSISEAITELAQTGYARAERELDVEVEYLGDQRFTDLEEEYRALGDSGTEIVLIDDFHNFEPWIVDLVADYPDTAFIAIGSFGGLPGTLWIDFADEQAGFLAGVAAALESDTGVVGFIGGIRLDSLEKWRAGYEAGAKTVNPDVQVLGTYVSGDAFEGFEEVGPGRAVALDLYARGADVVLHAAGTASVGAIEAAREHSQRTGDHVWAITPDSDWSLEISEDLQPYLLTSALKRYDVAVFDAIEAYTTGDFSPGEQVLTLSSGAIGLATSDYLSPAQLTTIDELTAQIIANELIVPDTPTGELLPRLVVTESAPGEGDILDDIDIGDGFGEYDVGLQRITIPDPTGGTRDLDVDVWFPIVDTEGLSPGRFPLADDFFFESTHAFVATVAGISLDGPFPLVVYSHGEGAAGGTYTGFTESVASNGYIVAAPNHKGDWFLDNGDPEPTALLNRPHDVSAVIDGLLGGSGNFAAHIASDQIAVSGHSGFTAYAVAAGYDNELGEYMADERVGALIALAPEARGLSDERLASVTIPALVMIGTDDNGGGSATRPWELSASGPAYRVDLVGAEFLSFTDICAYARAFSAAPDLVSDLGSFVDEISDQGCDPGDFPYDRALGITNTFAATFLDSVFRGTDAIQLDEVDGQPDLIYQVK